MAVLFGVETDEFDLRDLIHDEAVRLLPRDLWVDAPPVWLQLLESATRWEEHKHPRWPKGSKNPVTGKSIAGQFMEVGQEFLSGGKKFEIAFFGPKGSNALWAHRAGGPEDVGLVRFDVASKGGGEDGAAPTVLGVQQAEATKFVAGKSHDEYGGGGLKKKLTGLTVDPYVDKSTHDPLLELPHVAGQKVTAEDWLEFGKADQENFIRLAQEFGHYAAGENAALVKQQLKGFDHAAISDAMHAYTGQHGSSSGTRFNFSDFVQGITDKLQLTSGQARRERAKRVLQEVAAVIQWDLYNRVRSPDVTVQHKDGQSPGWWIGEFVEGPHPIMSGLSQSWNASSWSGDTWVMTPLAIRAVVMNAYVVQPASAMGFSEGYKSENEIATPDQLMLDGRTVVFSENKQLKASGLKTWLAQETSKPAGGRIARMMWNYIKNGKVPPLPPPPAEIKMQGSGAKLWLDPPPGVGKEVLTSHGGVPFSEPKSVAQLGYVLMDGGEPVSKPANSWNLKAGDFIEGQQGARYVVITDPGNTTGFQFRRAEINAQGDWNGAEPYQFSEGGNKLFKLLDGHTNLPKPQLLKDEGPLWDPQAWLNGSEIVKAGALAQGQIFKVNDIPYMSLGGAQIKDLNTGKLGSINVDYQATPLVTKAGYVAVDTTGHTKMAVGVTFAYQGEKYVVTKLLKGGQVQAKRYNKPGVVKLDADDPAFDPGHLHNPALYEIEEKPVKLGSMVPNTRFQGGNGSLTQKAFLVLGPGEQPKTTEVRNLDTGEVSSLKDSAKYRRLVPVTQVLEADAPVNPDAHVPGNWMIDPADSSNATALGVWLEGEKVVFTDPVSGKPVPEYQAEILVQPISDDATEDDQLTSVKWLTGPHAGETGLVDSFADTFRLVPHEEQDGPVSAWSPAAYIDGPVMKVQDMPVGTVYIGGKGVPYMLKSKTAPSGATATNLVTGKPYPALGYDKEFLTQLPKAGNKVPYAELVQGDVAELKELMAGDQFEVGDDIFEVTKWDLPTVGPSFVKVTPFGKVNESTAPSGSMLVKFHAFSGQGYDPVKVVPPVPMDGSLFPAVTEVPGSAAIEKAETGGFEAYDQLENPGLDLVQLKDLSAETTFKGFKEKVFFVKQPGATPIISDGIANYFVDGNSYVLTDLAPDWANVGEVIKQADTSPPLGLSASSSEQATALAALVPNPRDPPWGVKLGDLHPGDWVKLSLSGPLLKVTDVGKHKGQQVVMLFNPAQALSASYFGSKVPYAVAKLSGPKDVPEFNANDYVAELKLSKAGDLAVGDVFVTGDGSVLQKMVGAGESFVDAVYKDIAGFEGDSFSDKPLVGQQTTIPNSAPVTKMVPKLPAAEEVPVESPPYSWYSPLDYETSQEYVHMGELKKGDVVRDPVDNEVYQLLDTPGAGNDVQVLMLDVPSGVDSPGHVTYRSGSDMVNLMVPKKKPFSGVWSEAGDVVVSDLKPGDQFALQDPTGDKTKSVWEVVGPGEGGKIQVKVIQATYPENVGVVTTATASTIPGFVKFAAPAKGVWHDVDDPGNPDSYVHGGSVRGWELLPGMVVMPFPEKGPMVVRLHAGKLQLQFLSKDGPQTGKWTSVLDDKLYPRLVPPGDPAATGLDAKGLHIYKGGEMVYLQGGTDGGPVWTVDPPSKADPKILSLTDDEGNKTKIGKAHVKPWGSTAAELLPDLGGEVKPSQVVAGMSVFIPSSGASMFVNSVTPKPGGSFTIRTTNVAELGLANGGPLDGVAMDVSDAALEAYGVKWLVQSHPSFASNAWSVQNALDSVPPLQPGDEVEVAEPPTVGKMKPGDEFEWDGSRWAWGWHGPVQGAITATNVATGDEETFDLNLVPDSWSPGKEPLPVESVAKIKDPKGKTTDDGTVELTKPAGGTTGAMWGETADGKKVIVKAYGGKVDRVATEWLTNQLYQKAGAKVPEGGLKLIDGKMAYVYEAVPGVPGSPSLKVKKPSAAVGAMFMMDALTANWDVVGLDHDNLLWPEGTTEADIAAGKIEPVRLDQGGTLQFRAQGAKKEFGPVPKEVDSMLVVGQGKGTMDVPQNMKVAQAKNIVSSLPPSVVDALVEQAPFEDEMMRAEVRAALNARVAWMAKFAGVKPPKDNVGLGPQPVSKTAAGTPPPKPVYTVVNDYGTFKAGEKVEVANPGGDEGLWPDPSLEDGLVVGPGYGDGDVLVEFSEGEQSIPAEWIHKATPEVPTVEQVYVNGTYFKAGDAVTVWAPEWAEPLQATIDALYDDGTAELTYTSPGGKPPTYAQQQWLQPPSVAPVKHEFVKGGQVTFLDKKGAHAVGVVTYVDPKTSVLDVKVGKATVQVQDQMLLKYSPPGWVPGLGDYVLGSHLKVGDSVEVQTKALEGGKPVYEVASKVDNADGSYTLGLKLGSLAGKPPSGEMKGQIEWTGTDASVAAGSMPNEPSPWKLVGVGGAGAGEDEQWKLPDSVVEKGGMYSWNILDGTLIRKSPNGLTHALLHKDGEMITVEELETGRQKEWPAQQAYFVVPGMVHPDKPSKADVAAYEKAFGAGGEYHGKQLEPTVSAPLPGGWSGEPGTTKDLLKHFPMQEQLDKVVAKYGGVDSIPVSDEAGYGSEWGSGGKFRYRPLVWVPEGGVFHMKGGGEWQKIGSLAEGVVVLNMASGEAKRIFDQQLRVKPPAGKNWKHDPQS